MTYKIFIDSNIYLRFYDSNSSEYKKLLKSLVELKDNIFVTKQISNEVMRNKAQIFRRSFDSYISNIKTFPKVHLPEHLDGSQSELKKWNKEREAAGKENIKQEKTLNKIYKETLEKIINSEDHVSLELENIFLSMADCNDIEFTLAKQRKEKGNPPGKVDDPIGDQLNWEMLLNRLSGLNELFIISNDFDFFINDGETCYLNPMLLKEIKDKNSSLRIKCFNTLSDALTELNKINSVDINLPEKKILKEIKNEEISNASVIPNNSGSTIHYFSDHIKVEEKQRIKYLFRQHLMYEQEAIDRLANLGITKIDAIDFLERP